MRGATVAFVLVAACGRLGFDPSTDGGAAADIAPLGPFGSVTPLANVNTASVEADPTITADGLELYFTSNRGGTSDIFVSRRTAITDPWGTPSVVTEVSSASLDSGVDVSPDGLVMTFGSDRLGSQGDLDIWISTRATRADPWGMPVVVPDLSSTAHDNGVTWSVDRLEVFFQSQRSPATTRELWRAVRPDVGSLFATPVEVASLDTPDYNGNPALSNGDLLLWFNSGRAGGQGVQDIWVAQRASAQDSTFTPPTPVAEVSSASTDEDPWLSADGRWIVFTSDRGGDLDLYEAHR